mgnify:CR=1 FL=1
MSGAGIRDRVAIVGMGCTRFAEHWDKSIDDMLVEAVEACVDSADGLGLSDVEAFWVGTKDSGQSATPRNSPTWRSRPGRTSCSAPARTSSVASRFTTTA